MRALVVVLIVIALASAAYGQRDKAVKHFEQGEAFMKTEQYDLAAKEYEKAYAALPKAGFLFNIALAHESAGARAKAIEHYQRYLKESPEGAAAQEARARLAKLEREAEAEADKRRTEEARRAEEAAQRQQAAQHLATAEMRYSNGDYDGAIDAYREAYEISNDPERLFDIATAYREAGNAVEAKVHFESYLAEAPTGARHMEARRNLETLSKETAEITEPEGRGEPSGPPAVSAVVEPPYEPPKWSFGAKLGISQTESSAEGFGQDCRRKTRMAPAATAFGAFRLHRRVAVQAGVGFQRWSAEIDCDGTSVRDANAAFLTLPTAVSVAPIVGRSFEVRVSAGVGLLFRVSTDDTVELAELQTFAAAGLELGIGAGPGRIVLDAGYQRAFHEVHMEVSGVGGFDSSGTNTFSTLVGYRVGR